MARIESLATGATPVAPKKILVAEDHELVRDTVCALLEADGKTEVWAVADAWAAAAAIEGAGGFDFVLMDYNMPGMDQLDGLDRILAMNGGRRVGLMSGNVPFEVIEAAIARGASGYVPKSLEPKLIVKAVRQMAEGQKFSARHFLTRYFDQDG